MPRKRTDVSDQQVMAASFGANPFRFRSQFDRLYNQSRSVEAGERFPQEPGMDIVPLYTAAFDDRGVLQLTRDGEHNLYADIQSHALSTDLETIVERYFSGDPTALNRVQGTYMDVSEVPGSFHDAMSLMDNARRHFAELPPDVRDRFNNDANQWLAILGTPEWREKMEIVDSASGPAPAGAAPVVNSAQDGGADS